MSKKKKDKIVIEDFGDRRIAIQGIGRLFYETGFPISMSVSKLREQGVEVSMLHVADECLKNGWSVKTTITRLTDDFGDDLDGNVFDIELLTRFCNAEYEEQRAMIFEYLFGGDIEEAKAHIKGYVIRDQILKMEDDKQ